MAGTPSITKAADNRIAKHFTPTVVEQLQQIEAEMGGRSSLVGMLVLAPLTPDLKYVLGLLGDPQHQSKSLAAICALGNILPGELLKHLASAALLRGKVRASQKIAEGIAAVTEDVMKRAAPYEDACSTCRGTGSMTPEPSTSQPNPSPAACETCLGTGKLLYRPDLERQKLAIEMAQLLPKSGGIQIAMQQNNASGGSGGGGMMERLTALTDKILYGSGAGQAPDAEEDPPVEAEILDPPEADPPA